MREGVARDGSHLFPAFPYDHFTKLSDDDVRALYAYIMTRAPVRAPAQTNGLPFPFNIRALQAGWKLLFFRPGRCQPDATQSAEWNRGAYLAEGLSHCGAFHTPRNLLGAEIDGDAYAGAVVEGWIAPPLTVANPAPAPWTQDELHSYLRDGVSLLHGTSAGRWLPSCTTGSRQCRTRMSRPLRCISPILTMRATGRRTSMPRCRVPCPMRPSEPARSSMPMRGFTRACASCHYNAKAPLAARPDLALNSAVSLSDPTNLVQVMLRGINANEGIPGVVMPGFAQGFADSDIARIAAYLRRTRTNLPPWTDFDEKITEIRQQISLALHVL
jgi:mono/diheme cytochrome c family protein